METRIAEAPRFRVYLGTQDDGQPVILKVAKTFDDGDVLVTEASRFNGLAALINQVAECESIRNRQNSHYDWLFAHLQSSFMEPSQDDRRINVYTTPGAPLAELVPLTKLHASVEIDPRTSVWLLGRFFKLYGFYELKAVVENLSFASYPQFSPDDYLVGPERHNLVCYNLSKSLDDVVAYDFVATIAEFMLNWTVTTDDPKEQAYQDLLQDLAKYGRAKFGQAHRDLYTLVRELWGIEYHPFTYRDRGAAFWRHIEKG